MKAVTENQFVKSWNQWISQFFSFCPSDALSLSRALARLLLLFIPLSFTLWVPQFHLYLPRSHLNVSLTKGFLLPKAKGFYRLSVFIAVFGEMYLLINTHHTPRFHLCLYLLCTNTHLWEAPLIVDLMNVFLLLLFGVPKVERKKTKV